MGFGDTHIYESMDPDGRERSLETRRTVTSTQGPLSSLSLDSKKAKPRLLHFNHERNLLGTRNTDGSGLGYSPPLKYYDFPLFPSPTSTLSQCRYRADQSALPHGFTQFGRGRP